MFLCQLKEIESGKVLNEAKFETQEEVDKWVLTMDSRPNRQTKDVVKVEEVDGVEVTTTIAKKHEILITDISAQVEAEESKKQEKELIKQELKSFDKTKIKSLNDVADLLGKILKVIQ